VKVSDVTVFSDTDDGRHRRRGREMGGSTRHKRKNFSELKAFVETKLRSRSEKALEKIGHEDASHSRRSSISDEHVSVVGGHSIGDLVCGCGGVYLEIYSSGRRIWREFVGY